MFISYNWIKTYLPNLTQTPDEVANSLSTSLAEVESIQRYKDDTIFEIKNIALSHRADLFGEIGFAREISAILNTNLLILNEHQLPGLNGLVPNNLNINISVQNDDLCPRYSCIIIQGININESPAWLKDRLLSVGMRPINNIVDITNYLMFKYGQPLHAFDLDQLAIENNNLEIEIRNAIDSEKLELIDGTFLNLTPQDLIIANKSSQKSIPIALAGIMGGKASEISTQTKNILIESANFNMYQIRKSSRFHAVRSDASLRFEKGIDPQFTTSVLKEAITMITGNINENLIVDSFNHQIPTKDSIHVNINDLNYYLNINLTATEIADTLTRLGCFVESKTELLIIKPPSFRKDLNTPEDVYEEIARIYDYNQITPTLPNRSILPAQFNPLWRFKNTLRAILTEAGAQEILQYSFVNEAQAGVVTEIKDNQLQLISKDIKGLTHIKNTLSPELSYMRTSLIPSLTNATIENAKRFDQFTIFEIGKVLDPKGEDLPNEQDILSIVYYSNKNQLLDNLKFIKGLWRIILDKIGAANEFHEWLPLEIDLGNTEGVAFGYEIDINLLLPKCKHPLFISIPSHPETKQDISFLISEDQGLASITQLIKTTVGDWLKEIEVIDIFQNEKMKSNSQKSITLRMYFLDPIKSIADEEINPIRERINQLLIQNYNATIR